MPNTGHRLAQRSYDLKLWSVQLDEYFNRKKMEKTTTVPIAIFLISSAPAVWSLSAARLQTPNEKPDLRSGNEKSGKNENIKI